MRRKKGDVKTKDILKKLKTNPNNYYQIKNRLYHELYDMEFGRTNNLNLSVLFYSLEFIRIKGN